MTGAPSSSRLSSIDRRALISVGIQFFVNGAASASFLSRLPELRDQIGADVSLFGALLTTVGLFGLAASAVAGRVVHRFGTRRVLTIGAFGLVTLLPVIGTVTAPWAFVIAVGMFMFGDVMVDIAMNLQGSWISARRRVPVMNRLHGLWSLGTVLGATAASRAAAAGMSLLAHLSLAAIATAVLVVVVARGVLRVDDDEHADASLRRAAAPVRSHRAIYALLALGGAFAVVSEQVGLDWSTFRLTDDFGASAATASLAYVAFTSGMALSRLGGDLVQSRLGDVRLHQVAVGLAGVGMAAASLVPVRWSVFVGFVLAGSGIAVFMPRLYDEAARAPGRRGAGLGMMTGGMRVGGLLAPIVVGGLAGTSLDVGAAMALVTLPSIVGYAVVTHLTGRRRPVLARAG